MKRINKTQLNEREKHAQDVRDAVSEYNGAVQAYNEALENAKTALAEALALKLADERTTLEDAYTKVNEALTAATEWRDEIVNTMDEYASNRSDKWQESDAASSFEEWKGEWENAELDNLDELEFPEIEIELPELEEIDDDKANAIDNLPEEVS